MNNQGQVVFLGLMLAIVIIILALALAPAVKEANDIARNESTDTSIGLNCSSDTISDYDKAACTSSDLTLFYFVGMLIFIGGAVLAAKIVLT